MDDKNIKEGLIGLVIFILFFVGIYFYFNKSDPDNIDNNIHRNEPVIDNNTHNNEPNKIELNEMKYKENVSNLGEVLLDKGYQKKDDCSDLSDKDDVCYASNQFEIVIDKQLNVSFTKSNVKNVSNYDSTNDLKQIGEILDYDTLSDNANSINKILNMISKNLISSFNIDTSGLYIHISYYSNLKYDFRTTINREDFDNLMPTEINLSMKDEKSSNSYIVKKDIYDMLVSNNKKYLKYYDYPYLHFNKDSNNFCEIEYHEKDGYTVKGSFCHYGSSTTSIEISSDNKENYDFISLSIVSNYFESNYKNIINNDLIYILDKLDLSYKIDNKLFDEIDDFMKKEGRDLKTNLTDNIELSINRTNYNRYNLKYIIR